MRPLSRGGMGAVLLAERRTHGIARRVAIKVIHPHLIDDPAARELFFAEARLAARFTHPNLVPVIDFGEDSGDFYLVMELVEGQTLLQLLRTLRAPMPPSLAARVAADAARGLAWAHALTGDDGNKLGVIHRDVSPDNLFVTRVGEVKVLDFGIAKSRARTEATVVGNLRGKPGYMAPERFRHGHHDDRVDVWSLGVVLFEMLAGARLFKSHGGDVVREIRGDLPPLPPQTPPELGRIVLDMLKQDASERPRMSVVVERLDRLLLSWGVAATPDALRRAIDDILPNAFGALSTTDSVPLPEGRAEGVETAVFTPEGAPDLTLEDAPAVRTASIPSLTVSVSAPLPRRRSPVLVGVAAALSFGLAAVGLAVTLTPSTSTAATGAAPLVAPAPPAPGGASREASGEASGEALGEVSSSTSTTTKDSAPGRGAGGEVSSSSPTTTKDSAPLTPGRGAGGQGSSSSPTSTAKDAARAPSTSTAKDAAPGKGGDTRPRVKPATPASDAAPAGLFVADRTPYVDVYVDGVRLGESPLGSVKRPAPVKAGRHAVRLVEPQSGKVVLERSVVFISGETVTLRP